jgi:hypothetical protein
MARAPRKRIEGVRQMLEHIEKHKNVSPTELTEVFRGGGSGHHVQPTLAAVCGRLAGKLNSGNVEAAFRFSKKKTIGTANLDESAGSAVATNELDLARKLPTQDRLAPDIVRITVRMLARKIAVCVVRGRIKPSGVRSANTTPLAAENIAVVLFIKPLVCGGRTTRWTVYISVAH